MPRGYAPPPERKGKVQDMTKQEFLDYVKELIPSNDPKYKVSDQDYSTIETVYQFHPSISDSNGKAEIAKLYVKFGMPIINDMKPRAELMAQKERELSDLDSSILALKQDMDILRNGGWV